VRHHGVDLDRTHALADGPLHAQEADAILVLHQLADGTHPPITQMVDVINLAAAILEFDQCFDNSKDVLGPQHAYRILGL
jgi:hypothetical protein